MKLKMQHSLRVGIGASAVFLSLLVIRANAAELTGPRVPMSSAERKDTLQPFHITSKPVIDGVFDEPFWKSAPVMSGFNTFLPDFGITPKEQTEVALAYDDENLYFAFRCYDQPDKIKTSISARDKMISDDFICINLDAFNDQQGLNAFYVNPNGIQGDSRFTAGNEDFSPDYVWYSAGKIDSAGYSVEVQIPLKSLRYTNADPTVMGMIFERYISRRTEHSSFPHMDPAKGFAILTEMSPIAYPGIRHYTLMEILPAITATRQDARQGDNLVRTKQEGEIGLTGKYGITPDLIFDATINPDFSQVESDAGQVDVNLRYSLSYPEKRSFFLEGKDNFNLSSSQNLYDPTIYYSRAIADPSVGAKVTGKLGPRNTLAAVYAMDRILEADRPVLGGFAHYPVVRFKRAFENDSYIGLLYAGRELEQSNNRVVGYDESYRLSDASTLESSGFLSSAKDNPAAPSIDGHTFSIRYDHETRDLDYNLNFRELSNDFRADMGFVTRTGIVNFIAFARPKIYPSSGIVQRVDIEFTSGQTQDRYSGLWETDDDLAFTMYFWSSWTFRTRAAYATEIFNGERFRTGGVHTQLRAQITKWIFTNLLYRRIKSILYTAAPEQGSSNVVSTSLIVQPTENIQIEGNFTYSDFTSDASGQMLYHYPITRSKLTYQVNQYLFFRAINQYNNYKRQLSNDFLASFTYIPGTVFYLGYGSVFNDLPGDAAALIEMQRGLFMKISYLWRA